MIQEPVPETRGMTLGWLALVYDWLCSTMGLGTAFRTLTLAHAALRPGEQVLDVGCGTGVLTRLASDAVGPDGRVVGFDPAPRMIAVARRNAARAGSRAEFRLLAVEDLPLEDGAFDIALASAVLHHLPRDVKRAGLREIWRVLRPAGRFLVVDLDRPGNLGWWLLTWPLALLPTTAPNMRGEIPEYLREAGFADVREVDR
jgi:ubiquinone/menaquinone biosynthesis C-methylase UbiE